MLLLLACHTYTPDLSTVALPGRAAHVSVKETGGDSGGDSGAGGDSGGDSGESGGDSGESGGDSGGDSADTADTADTAVGRIGKSAAELAGEPGGLGCLVAPRGAPGWAGAFGLGVALALLLRRR